VRIELVLLDQSPRRSRRRRRGRGRADSRAGDPGGCLAAFPEVSVDVVMCSLFLHHIPQAQGVVALLRKMGTAARHLAVISDLRGPARD